MPECKHGMLDPDWCDWCKHPEKMVPHVSLCGVCRAEVVWVRTEKGKSMPIDVEPGGDPDKARFRKERTVRVDQKIIGVVHFVRNNEIEANTRPLYCCHFETCKKPRPPAPTERASAGPTGRFNNLEI